MHTGLGPRSPEGRGGDAGLHPGAADDHGGFYVQARHNQILQASAQWMEGRTHSRSLEGQQRVFAIIQPPESVTALNLANSMALLQAGAP